MGAFVGDLSLEFIHPQIPENVADLSQQESFSCSRIELHSNNGGMFALARKGSAWLQIVACRLSLALVGA